MFSRSSDAISVVVPVHDVADYLTEFFASLDAQGDALPSDFIFIDDGSTDGSADLVQAWIDRSRPDAKLIRTENRGVSAARNTGLDEADRPWVLFVDPDDVLEPEYFAAIGRFLGEHPDVDLAATNLLRLQEPVRRLRDTHALRFRFAGGDRVAALEDDLFVMNAASVVFPTDAVRASGARFRTGLHASEDALFVAEYLLSLGRMPVAGFIATAKYGYRKRQARTSAVDRYRSDPSTYIVRFRDGYAPLLQRVAESGEVPCWLQSVLLYEMQWLLPVQLDPQRYAENLSDAQRAETLSGVAACLRHVSEERLLRYDATALPLEVRLLILALTERPLWDWAGPYATAPRRQRKDATATAYSLGAPPPLARGAVVTTWTPDYFGQRVLYAHRVRGVVPPRVVWPRAGESLAQTQDRHRRQMAGIDVPAIPAQEGEVYVRRTRDWASDSSAVRRESRRRGMWSRDAIIGRIFRPGRLILVEHADDDRAAELAAALRAQSGSTRVVLAAARGRSGAGLLRFASLRHRIARARARAIVSTSPTGRPSSRARLRGIRMLTIQGGVDNTETLAIGRFAPNLVITPVSSDAVRLERIGLASEDVVIVPDGTAAATARAILQHAARATTPTTERP